MMKFAVIPVLALVMVSSQTYTSERVSPIKCVFLAALAISGQICPTQALKIEASPGEIDDCLHDKGLGDFADKTDIGNALAYQDYYRGGEDNVALYLYNQEIGYKMRAYAQQIRFSEAHFAKRYKPDILKCVFRRNPTVLGAIEMIAGRDE